MKKVIVVVLAVAVVLCAACESKPTTENSTITISVVPPQTAEAQVVKEVDPCDSQFVTREVEIEELRLSELRHNKRLDRYNVDNNDDDEFSYENYTELTYFWDIVEMNRKRTRTSKSVPEILKYYYLQGAKEINTSSQEGTFRDFYVPDILREFESIAYQEKIFEQVMNSPEAIAVQAAFLLKTIPNGKKLALNWGKWFIEQYKDMDWDAEVGVLKKRTTVDIHGQNHHFCNTESVTNVTQNHHPVRRDSQGRFINEGLKQCLRDDYSNWGDRDDYFCPVMVFVDQGHEDDWTYIDKQVWRAGPKFYTNVVKIIYIVWDELGIEP